MSPAADGRLTEDGDDTVSAPRGRGGSMTGSVNVDDRVAAERERLLSVLDGADDDQWRRPSLCTGWSVRDLVVHLLMPYELSMPRFLLLMLRARWDFDRAVDRWATTDPRSPAEVVAALRATEHRTFAASAGAPGPRRR
jgi:uncharacterized protein (TIGR03083 family)